MDLEILDENFKYPSWGHSDKKSEKSRNKHAKESGIFKKINKMVMNLQYTMERSRESSPKLQKLFTYHFEVYSASNSAA